MSPGAPLGSPRVHLRSTDSTNERARQLASAGAPHGTLVTAAEQTAGRGRQGRRWAAPPGSSLLASLVLTARSRMLPLAAAVAVCETIEWSGSPAGGPALIKWPNDIVVARGGGLAKLAGILIEARPQQGWAVLGIGLNAAVELDALPVELRDSAATLGLSPASLEPLLEHLLEALGRALEEPPQETLAAWNSRDALRGRQIEWGTPDGVAAGAPQPAGSGVARGIDDDGRLLVELAGGGRTALGAGEVHLRPLA